MDKPPVRHPGITQTVTADSQKIRKYMGQGVFMRGVIRFAMFYSCTHKTFKCLGT